MTALFIVRAEVGDAALRDAFDRWYRDEHLPDAQKAFNARQAWRGWSDLDSCVHYAWYEFEDLPTARSIQGSPALKRMVAEFDRVWGDKVKRSRDFAEIVQTVGG